MTVKLSQAEKDDIARLSEAWQVADEAKRHVKPLLKDDDLTLDRYLVANPLLTRNVARDLLEKLVKEGKLIKVPCRTLRAGHPVAYRKPE